MMMQQILQLHEMEYENKCNYGPLTLKYGGFSYMQSLFCCSLNWTGFVHMNMREE
jgi:hypothetical protein